MRLGIIGIQTRITRMEKSRGVDVIPPRVLIWSHWPDDPKHEDGPVLLEDFLGPVDGPGRMIECANGADLAATMAELEADGKTMRPIRRRR